jgi:CRISPR-associated endonuclease/helicase Cas3
MLLAKSSGETIMAHTKCCREAALALVDGLPLPDEERRSLGLEVLAAVTFHDLGKGAEGFQRLLRGEQKTWGGRRHEILSAAFASSLKWISPAVVFAIITHHKSLPADGIAAHGPGCLPAEQLPWSDDLPPVWNEMVREWQQNSRQLLTELQEMLKALDGDLRANMDPVLSPLCLCRAWLSRSTGRTGQRLTVSFAERFHASRVRGLTIAADHLGSAHLVPPPVPEMRRFAVWPGEMRRFQEVAATTDGSAILRAPTGSGKTEAALLWAQRNQAPKGRLFYVLPYTASINAMYERLGPGHAPDKPGIFGDQHVGLLHSRAAASLYSVLDRNDDLSSRLDQQETAKALAGLAREMWFPIRVCTPHQILRYLLRGKGWETMLAEFPSACFIFDEIHAYDPRIVGITLASAGLLTKWGAKCLFISATLPKFLETLVQDSFGKIPTIVLDPRDRRDSTVLSRTRHSVAVVDGTLLSRVDEVIGAISTGGSTLVVCNHVRTARTIFDRLRERLGEGVVLLHSQFNQEDRNAIESSLQRKQLPKVLVATQVVEVSLDIDFDRGFFEPAPIDALVQRMGRVNRAGSRAEPAAITVFTEQVNSWHLYCDCPGNVHEMHCRVRRSIEELARLENPVSETGLITAADRIYSNGYTGEEGTAFEEGFSHPDIVRFEERLLAGAHQDWVEQLIESADRTVEVLPESLVEEYEDRRRKGLWIEANSLLVTVRRRSLRNLGSDVVTSADPWVVKRDYSHARGLDW